MAEAKAGTWRVKKRKKRGINVRLVISVCLKKTTVYNVRYVNHGIMQNHNVWISVSRFILI